MTESHYEEIVRNSLERFRALYQQREEIDVELVKLRQFLYATLNMVPDEHRSKWESEISVVVDKASASAASLADSIRRVFDENTNMTYSVAGMREQLMQRGFDFSGYKSNPLSSISTTLRRMVETGELRTGELPDGPTMFMLVEPRPRIPSNHPLHRLKYLYELNPTPKIGTDPKLNSAYESGMRGTERPRKNFGEKIADGGRIPFDARKKH